MKIGIFGGAFNPPHIEHVNIVKKLMIERKYDKVLIIPSVNPPHKKSVVTPFENRYEMVKIAFRDFSNVEILDIENRDTKVHYSYDIIRRLQDIYMDDALEFIIGGDSMIDFHTWYKPREIANLIPIVVVARGKDDMDIVESEITRYNALGGDIHLSRYVAKEISSSYLRCKLYLHDEDVDIDVDIKKYIDEHHLYCDYDEIIAKLKSILTPHRFEHTKGVCRYAMKLNENLRLDFNSVMLATLLHDSAKGAKRYDYEVPADSIGTPVEHAFMGEKVAKYEYHIDDENILSAIKYHCTAKPKMTRLEKLVYTADMIELGRDYEGVEDLRRAVDEDFDEGFKVCLNATYEHIKSEGNEIYPLTIDAYNYYNNIGE